MNQKFTEKIGLFLALEKPTDQEIIEAATLLLQCDPNRERGIYNSALRRPQSMLPWIRTDLKKYYKIRSNGLKRPEVEKFNAETERRVRETLSMIPEGAKVETSPQIPVTGTKGKRADHDQLPEAIQQLYEENVKRWIKIRQAHNQLLVMVSKPGYQACDGNELCSVLRQTDDQLRKDYKLYDSYVIRPEQKEVAKKDSVDVFTDNLKTVANARTAITRGLARKTQDEKSLKKIQDAVDTLIALNQKLMPATIKKLQAIDIKFNA